MFHHQRTLMLKIWQQQCSGFVSQAPWSSTSATLMSKDWWITKVDRSYTPSHHPLFCLWASINFTSICLSIGRKVRAAPTNKGSVRAFWKHCHLPFWANSFKEKKNRIWTCETDNLRFSSVSRLLSHSSLTTPHGTFINLWFMQSKFPVHLGVITLWLRFSLWGSDVQVGQLILHSGADQKAINPGKRWW